MINATLPIAWDAFKPHALQSEMWRQDKRFVVAACGRGSGKTAISLRRLALRIRLPGTMHFYAGPTVQQSKRIAWDTLLKLIPPSWVKTVNVSTLTIKSVFDSELHVLGMDKPMRIEGSQWDGGVLDEMSDQKPGAFEKSVFPALTHKNGWCWRIGVPKRTGVGARQFKEIFDAGMEGADNQLVSYTWPSSTVLPPEVMEQARSLLDERDFNEQFNASWESSSGAIYYAFSKDTNLRECKYNPDIPIVVGSDFNVTPMSWTLGHDYMDSSDPRVEIFSEVRLNDTNTPATLDYLHRKYQSHTSGWMFYGDAAGKQRHTNAATTDYQLVNEDQRFSPKRVFYPHANPLIKDRFAATNAMLRNAAGRTRLFIDPECRYLIDDLRHRAYKEGTMEPDDPPMTGHMSDSLDYFMWGEYPVGHDANCCGTIQVGSL